MTLFIAGALVVGSLLAMRWMLNDGQGSTTTLHRLGVFAALILATIMVIAGGSFYGLLILAMACIPLYTPLRNTIATEKINIDLSSLFPDRDTSSDMTHQQALSILGLSGNPSVEEIKKAHKSLIRKVHPDNGGSDYLSHQVNQARDILINS